MIKRMLVLGLAAVVVWGVFIYRDEDILFKAAGRGEVSYYTKYAAGDVRYATVVQNGRGSIVTCDFSNYKSVRSSLNDISGVSIRFRGDYSDVESLISQLEIKSVAAESLDEYGIVSYYGFTFKLRNRVYADGKYINIQIVLSGNTITIGYPIILGSY